jgi:peroxidase
MQFINHDSSLSAGTTEGYRGDEMLACNCLSTDPECLIIPTPRGDELNYDQACYATARTAHTFADNDCKMHQRQQINANTAYFDLSTVYGSSEEEANSLRQFADGLLRYVELSDETGEYLPVFDKNGKYEDGMFLAGDVRVNDNLILQSLHTLFLREHNRLARGLANVNHHWDDERLFQEARRINIAQYQKIIFL